MARAAETQKDLPKIDARERVGLGDEIWGAEGVGGWIWAALRAASALHRSNLDVGTTAPSPD